MNSSNGFSEFMLAITKNDIDEIERLFQVEFINMRNESGHTALHYASDRGYIEIVKYLIGKGWDIDAEDNNKKRPYDLAAHRRFHLVKKILIESGCRLEQPKKSISWFINQYKSMQNDKELLKLLRSVDYQSYSTARKIELSLLLDEVVAVFNEKYKELIFAKFLNKLPLDYIEISKGTCMTLSMILLAIFNIALTEPSIRYNLIQYLKGLSHVTSSNITARMMTEELFLSLHYFSRRVKLEFTEDEIYLLWTYFRIYSKYDAIKIPSGYLLLSAFNNQEGNIADANGIGDVVKYLNEVIERTQTTKPHSLTSFSIGPDERSEIAFAISESSTPCLTSFEKLSVIGVGGFGHVYLCHDPIKNVHFGLKEIFIPSDRINAAQRIESISNEINIFKKCNGHKRIVRYFGTNTSDSIIQVFMEYMPGGSLLTMISKNGPLTPKVIGIYTRQILEGLKFLHENDIIHRDIKAANILLYDEENIKICDFGISRYLPQNKPQPTNPNCSEHAHTGCGTAYWMAPEIIRGEKYNSKVDIWSLGATVVEMLTGHHPYHGIEPVAAQFQVGITRKTRYTAPDNIPSTLQELLKKMFASMSKERPDASTLLQYDFNF